MKKVKRKILITGLLIGVFLITGCGAGGGVFSNPSPTADLEKITLEYWRVWDSSSAFKEIIEGYTTMHPQVTIRYKKFRYEEYEEELLNAFAEGRGPDVFSLHSGWMRRYQKKLEPMPPETTMQFVTTSGGLKNEKTVDTRTKKSLTPTDVRNNFVETVYTDAVIEDEVYGLPLSVDTMVIFYNRDLLNAAGVTSVPKYWDEDFLKTVQDLTLEDVNGNIVQSGVALGTSDNIQRYSDILSLLMMQNGVKMSDELGNVTFNQIPKGSSRDYNPALEALRFYTDFANPIKEVYTWNTEMPNSLDAFIAGRLAIFFGYSYHIPLIKAQAPRLNYSLSPMLQIEGNTEINFANYWLEAVSSQSAHTDVAWDFVQYATAAEQVIAYLNNSKKPTALRSLVDDQKESEDIGVFANQLLTATNWYRGKDYNAAEAIIGEMIDSAMINPEEMDDALTLAARKIQQTIK
ncbi:MAG: extracellular solute-binding protein [bacterium]|nr:extracellular solute-binding protein [bacterium]